MFELLGLMAEDLLGMDLGVARKMGQDDPFCSDYIPHRKELEIEKATGVTPQALRLSRQYDEIIKLNNHLQEIENNELINIKKKELNTYFNGHRKSIKS